MAVLKRVVKPKSKRSKRALEKREPKAGFGQIKSNKLIVMWWWFEIEPWMILINELINLVKLNSFAYSDDNSGVYKVLNPPPRGDIGKGVAISSSLYY